MIKRMLLIAVLGAGLLVTIPMGAVANGRDSVAEEARRRHNYERWQGYGGTYGFWHFRGLDRHPDLYFYPIGYEPPGSRFAAYRGPDHYRPGHYGPGLSDVFDDDYYLSFGYRCNGYRDGRYYDVAGRPISYYGRPFYRRNADCESFFRRHGYWYGFSDCSRFEVEKGYCDDRDRH